MFLLKHFHWGQFAKRTDFFAQRYGSQGIGIIKNMKKMFDPNNILNPGGTLGFDLSEEQKEKRWGYQK